MSTGSHPTEDPWAGFAGHERVVVAQDSQTGVAMVIAVHSTVLGPALGGTRMAAYADAPRPGAAAYADALRLSRAMTYKNALAGLDHGGGKGVILADSSPPKDPAVLHAYGRLVCSLDGAYVTAGDVGMTVQDMDVIGETCRWTTGRSPERGGVGDSGILTALGVFLGLQASAGIVFGTEDLAGRRVGVVGAGKVGGRLIGHLAGVGAEIVAVDPSDAVRTAIRDAHPHVRFADSVDELLAWGPEVLSPNAMGGLLTPELAARLTARLVCGGTETILVVEDETPVRELVCTLLKAQGYQILQADSGAGRNRAGTQPGQSQPGGHRSRLKPLVASCRRRSFRRCPWGRRPRNRPDYPYWLDRRRHARWFDSRSCRP